LATWANSIGLVAIFGNEVKDVVKRLAGKEFSSSEERDALLRKLTESEGVRARDVVWMLFRPDRAMRDTALVLLKKLRDPETLPLFAGEAKSKPEAAVRAAATVLFTLGLPGLERQLVELVGSPDQGQADVVRRIVLEAPVSKPLEPVLWQLATSGAAEDRVLFIGRLGTLDLDPKLLPRWEKLARDPDRAVREKALEILAGKGDASLVDLFVEQLALVGYATQQHLVAALARIAAGQGPEYADRILPLMAAGDPATRSAVLKILIAMPNRAELVKHYIRFSKTLAGWARDRALESMKDFGEDLIEPTIELLADPDEEVRSAAMIVAASFEDRRIVPATLDLLKDPDWWIRITAVDTLGRLADPRAVEPLMGCLDDPEVRWSAVEALGRIADPRALNALGKLLADPAPDVRVEVLLALRNFRHPQVLEVLQKVAESDPVREVRTRALEIAEAVAMRERTTLSDPDKLRVAATQAKVGQGEPEIHGLLVATRNQGGSDLHVTVSQPPIVRVAAELRRAQAAPFTAAQTEKLIRPILSDAQWERLEREQQLDFCYWVPHAGRYRANVFVDHRGLNGVFRVIPEKPPTITEIGLPPHLAEIASYHQGLVLVCGPSGSGKSTTLAALVNLFNETRHDHVLTLEDPVEFVHPFKNCLVNQREVGKHTGSFARALRAALREDPDVIVIGEMRDNETISLALTAAETGHIVLGTLNSTSAPKAIDRIIASFPVDEQAQIRTALSESMKYVVAQRLLPALTAHKQVACFEILKGTSSVANMIRDEKTYQIPSAMQIGRAQGMQTFDEALKDLVKRKLIAPEAAYMACEKKEDFEPLVSAEFLKSMLSLG